MNATIWTNGPNVLKCREYNQHYIDRLRKKIATYQRQGWRGRL